MIVDAEGEGILGEFTFTGEAFEEPNTEPADTDTAETEAAPAKAEAPAESMESAESAE